MTAQPKKKETFTEILAAHLKEDKRILKDPVAQKKVFSDAMYAFHLLVYAGIPEERQFREGLLTGIVVYKEENLRIQFKLHSAMLSQDPEKVITQALEGFQAEGKTPLHFVRDAKDWCNIPYTERDVSTLLDAGINVH